MLTFWLQKTGIPVLLSSSHHDQELATPFFPEEESGQRSGEEEKLYEAFFSWVGKH